MHLVCVHFTLNTDAFFHVFMSVFMKCFLMFQLKFQRITLVNIKGEVWKIYQNGLNVMT
jgi:hypothetical protein